MFALFLTNGFMTSVQPVKKNYAVISTCLRIFEVPFFPLDKLSHLPEIRLALKETQLNLFNVFGEWFWF